MPDFDLPHDPRRDAGDPPPGHWPAAAGPSLAPSAVGTSVNGGGPQVGRVTDSPVEGGAIVGSRPLEGPRARLSARPPGVGLALLQIVACSGYPTQILIVMLMTLLGFKQVTNPDEWSLGYVGTLLVLDSILVVSLVVLFLRLQGERPMDVFLGMQPVPGEIVRGLLLVPLVFAMVGVIAVLVQRYAPSLHQETNPFQSLIRAPHGILVVSALSIIVGGLREEVQRAFVLHRFTQVGVPVLGLIVFSLLFGLGHLVQGWDAVIMTAALGATWGAVYLRRRSLVAPVVCHGLFDVIQVAALGFLP